MTRATTAPLTWPPASQAPARWLHYLIHVTADIHARLGNAHRDLTGLPSQGGDRYSQ